MAIWGVKASEWQNRGFSGAAAQLCALRTGIVVNREKQTL
ncbi:hypothetical protein PLANPX_0509 [Lacipirellula parvula]|uniref:Uncharacterized protein n=1 Tax=Lacipirellula parvula TaxID=2650471 RepID=A0A5K7X519_9BACT|nr:hypothetical protein PLANPX_0509 [Lacipirellula parvula]